MSKVTKINVILLAVAFIASSFGFSAYAGSAPSLSGESVNVTGPHNAVLTVFVNHRVGNHNHHILPQQVVYVFWDIYFDSISLPLA